MFKQVMLYDYLHQEKIKNIRSVGKKFFIVGTTVVMVSVLSVFSAFDLLGRMQYRVNNKAKISSVKSSPNTPQTKTKVYSPIQKQR